MGELLGLIAAALTIRACWIEVFGPIPMPQMPQFNFAKIQLLNRKNQDDVWVKLLSKKQPK
jgi:hypothetical protein